MNALAASALALSLGVKYQAIKDGLSYKLVAAKYFISIDTVRQHIKNIYSKLEINSKAELINIYYKDLL